MGSSVLADLLKLPFDERADLAIALWESLSDAEREAEFDLSDELAVELGRRMAEHESDPASAVSWSELRRKLGGA